MSIPGVFISDESGEPRVVYVKGGDPSDPKKVVACYQEVRPGGMVVTKAIPAGYPGYSRITVAADPAPPPTQAQVDDERRQRQIDSLDRERAALVRERNEVIEQEPEPPESEPVAPSEDESTEPDEQEQEEAEARARAARTAGKGAGSRGRPRVKASA